MVLGKTTNRYFMLTMHGYFFSLPFFSYLSLLTSMTSSHWLRIPQSVFGHTNSFRPYLFFNTHFSIKQKKIPYFQELSQHSSHSFHSEFSNERVRVERRAKFQKTRTKRLYSTMFNSYYHWISQAGTAKLEAWSLRPDIASNRAVLVIPLVPLTIAIPLIFISVVIANVHFNILLSNV